MSKSSITSQNVSVSGDGLNLVSGPYVLQNANAQAPTGQSLSAGNNTISVPTGALSVQIVPPPSNSQTLTLKGVAGDTGVALSKVAPTTWVFDAPAPISFVLAAGGTVQVTFYWG